jgi:TolB protein
MFLKIASASLAGLALAAAPALATFPGANGRLVVQRPAGKQFDLYTLEADGSAERAVRKTPSLVEEEPAWSPDGQRLAYSLGPEDAFASEIVTTDAEGHDLTRVTRFHSVSSSVNWSPAGDRLAFFSLKDFPHADLPPAELYTIGTDGRQVRRLTRDRQIQTDPVFSPDGTRLAYVQWRAVKGQKGVFDTALKVSDADGSHARTLTRITARRDTLNATWSPDGEWLAFEVASPRPHGVKGGRQSDIAIIRPDGTGERRLTRTRKLETNPVWSPDGTSIAFVSDRHRRKSSGERDNRAFELYVMNADGTGIRRVTHNNVADTHPDWQPLPAPVTPDQDLRAE